MKKTNSCKTVMISSTKGGVGKTIFSINLAGVFSTLEQKVLLIDMDLTSGSLALYLNKPYDKSIYDVVEDLKNNMFDKFDNYTLKYNDYIDCLACPKDPRDASKIDIGYLNVLLNQASFIYDTIIIDTNHDINPVNLFLMDKVDQILFLITNDPLNLKSMKSLLSILNNMDIKNYKVLLNNSVNPYKDYFSLYDIKSVIKANIDYTLSQSFFIDNIDKTIMAGKIITLDGNVARVFNKDYSTLMLIAADINGEEKNHGKKKSN